MKTVIEHMRSLCPISDETVEELMKCVTLCHFPTFPEKVSVDSGKQVL